MLTANELRAAIEAAERYPPGKGSVFFADEDPDEEDGNFFTFENSFRRMKAQPELVPIG